MNKRKTKKKKRTRNTKAALGGGGKATDGSVKPPTGLMKPLRLSKELANVVGVSTESRPMVVKLLWKYIKANELQDQSNGQFINCDSALKAVLKTDRVHMLGMQKLLSPHFLKDEAGGNVASGNGSIA